MPHLTIWWWWWWWSRVNRHKSMEACTLIRYHISEHDPTVIRKFNFSLLSPELMLFLKRNTRHWIEIKLHNDAMNCHIHFIEILPGVDKFSPTHRPEERWILSMTDRTPKFHSSRRWAATTEQYLHCGDRTDSRVHLSATLSQHSSQWPHYKINTKIKIFYICSSFTVLF